MNIARVLALSVALPLAACGGGGGAGVDGVPSSGDWTWVLKAEGPTSSLTYGLSLVSPDAPGTQYRVEYGSAVLTDARVVSTASIDVAGRKTGTLRPYALVYIVGGNVRRVPLQANGKLPSTLVQRAQSTTACSFLTDEGGRPAGDAIDYANPENSRFVVTTAGADGQCGSADDGTAEVRLTATGGLVFTASAGNVPLGYFRSATTFAPAGWIFTRSVTAWDSGSGTSTTVRASSAAAFQSVVQAAPASALMDDGARLSVLDFGTAGVPTETALDTSSTSGGGWLGIGFDADAFYAYRNSGDASGQWTVLKVARSSPHATVLATGSGEISVASMGSALMYLTVFGSSGNSLVSVSKASGAPTVTLESGATSTLTTVQTSASGVHELWRVVNVGTAALNYQLEFIDEAGTLLYSTNAGGYPLTAPDAAVQRFDTSESRTRFVFASGYGSRAFGDATLAGYDAATKTLTTYGTLPGAATFGVDTVFAGVTAGPGSSMAGFAARTADGVIDASGTQVFSFDFGTAGSLRLTTATQ
jgi:hypothetical protein